jgi:hypothetical protein
MKSNFTEVIIRRSLPSFYTLVPIGQQTWPPAADFSIWILWEIHAKFIFRTVQQMKPNFAEMLIMEGFIGT